MYFLHLIKHTLLMAAAMSQEMLWPVVLGLLLSALIQSLVPKVKIAHALGKNTPGSAILAGAAGAASSSCSYAAVALARTLFQKGASLANSIIFEFGSTNLVFDLGVVIFALLGWQFLAAQYFGAVVMIVVLSLLFKLTLSSELELAAHAQAQRGLAGKMEAHANMDMTAHGAHGGSLLGRMFSRQSFTTISHYFCMDLLSLLPELITGILIASILGTVVPAYLWQKIFFSHDPSFAFFWGPIIGPFISMASFVCSIGNVPLAVVLWRSGISFGGIISFIFADLLILPILNIYRKYYGAKVAVYLLIVSYVSMVLSGMSVELVFNWLGIIPSRQTVETSAAQQLHLQYTVIFDIAALSIAALLGWRFYATGGAAMLKHINGRCCSTEQISH